MIMTKLHRFSAVAVSLALGAFALVGCESDSSGDKDKAESVEAKQQTGDKTDKQGTAAKSGDSDKQANNDGKLADAPDKAKVGKTAPNFTLTDTAGNEHTLSDYVGDKMVVLEWTSPECPYVQRHYKAKTMQNTIDKLGGSDNVAWFAINSNKGEAEVSKKWKKKHDLNFPILIDEEGEVGKMYGAKTTPHMYIIDKEGVLRYNGAIDNDKRGDKKAENTTNYVVQAGMALKNGESIAKKTTDAYGCTVKYDG
jgi:peroxiredoxin